MLSGFSCAWLFATLLTLARQAPLSMGFSRQEHWSGLPLLLQGIFLTQGSHLCLFLLNWQAEFFFSKPLEPPGKPLKQYNPSNLYFDWSSINLFVQNSSLADFPLPLRWSSTSATFRALKLSGPYYVSNLIYRCLSLQLFWYSSVSSNVYGALLLPSFTHSFWLTELSLFNYRILSAFLRCCKDIFSSMKPPGKLPFSALIQSFQTPLWNLSWLAAPWHSWK